MRARVLGIVVIAGAWMAGCPADDDSTDAGAGAGLAIGEACIPADELDPTFQGFSVDDVSVETNAAVCASQVCLVNHFQGRTTCPFGQTAPGVGPVGPAGSPAARLDSNDGCVIPGAKPSSKSTAWQVTATNVSVAGFSAGVVPAQITGLGPGDRTADKTVYCSCRCANLDGEQDDAGPYCTCPSGFACTPLVTSIGASDLDIAGSYCVLLSTTYSAADTDSANVCRATVTDTLLPGYCSLTASTVP
jgi:hypothetical protein